MTGGCRGILAGLPSCRACPEESGTGDSPWKGDSGLREGAGEGWTLACPPWTAGDLGPRGGVRSDRELQRPGGLQRAAEESRSSVWARTFDIAAGRNSLTAVPRERKTALDS